ncbi:MULTISPECIES: acyl carrier protein [Micromonospora]|uniref:Acyl carrier protein n=1 Tax=Micromonospora robiginosa TaxID=2749844 RepID=A0A7L6B4A6_9ACTN|nr:MULTISPECIES: acyl carrier protein [Micromonospora]QLQ36625.1 acyl carrier protein [Micromonospora ferruginea]WFF04534.1 acyl carrier protein [Micromonospora sp. WMMD1076]
MTILDLPTLTDILRECAGEDEDVELSGDILDVPFADLGYDSLALLETAGAIQRRFGAPLQDDAVTQAQTPRELLELANRALTAPA